MEAINHVQIPKLKQQKSLQKN